MGSSIALAAALAALATQPANQAVHAALRPSSAWNIEYADNMCILQRSFGVGGQEITVGFKPGPSIDHMRVMLGRRSTLKDVERGKAQITFDQGEPIEGLFRESFIGDHGIRLTVIDIKEFDSAPLKAAKAIRIRAGMLDVELAPNNVGAALDALRACEMDLLASWGMERAVVASIATFPKPQKEMYKFFNTFDYPAAAIRKEEQGTAGVRFWVGADGKARDCKLVETSGSPSIDAQTCAVIVGRARFEPARTKSGEPVPSLSFARIRWELPDY